MASLVTEAVLVIFYLKLLVTDPGLVPGGNPEDAALYWEALERSALPVLPPCPPCSPARLARPGHTLLPHPPGLNCPP